METDVTQCRVDDLPHLGHTPFYDVAKVLVVDVVVLFSNRPLCAFFEFVLSIAARRDGKYMEQKSTRLMT